MFLCGFLFPWSFVELLARVLIMNNLVLLLYVGMLHLIDPSSV